MKKYIPYLLAIVFCFIFVLSYPGLSTRNAKVQHNESDINYSYSVLQLFLDSEQNLKTLRRIKLFLAFQSVDEKTEQIIDEISETSSQSLKKMNTLLMDEPAIVITPLSDDMTAMATFDSLRTTTVMNLVFTTDYFERDLLINQAQVLMVISHLARQLSRNETNQQRKAWLNELATDYDALYIRVYDRIASV